MKDGTAKHALAASQEKGMLSKYMDWRSTKN